MLRFFEIKQFIDSTDTYLAERGRRGKGFGIRCRKACLRTVGVGDSVWRQQLPSFVASDGRGDVSIH